ncbi:MAG: hypothetical protein PSV22_21250 [Pseudolabrys sp.]|nr:hypothetical protein [Pseudolabrys sp.]
MAKMYRVYSIIKREKQDDYWLNIGVAFPHEDGKGFNVMLQALPIHDNGKIVLREHEPKDHEAEDAPAENRSSPRGSNKDNERNASRSSHRK